jgi:NADH-quinone oxidoreductase subunit K
MPTVSLSQYLMLAAVLFTIGAVGVVVRRNALTVLMSIELMLNAANLTFVAFSRFPLTTVARFPLTPDDVKNGAQSALSGHAAAFFVIATAAAEAAVGLAILIAVFRKRETTHVDEMTLIRDAEYQPESSSSAPVAVAHAESH